MIGFFFFTFPKKKRKKAHRGDLAWGHSCGACTVYGHMFSQTSLSLGILSLMHNPAGLTVGFVAR